MKLVLPIPPSANDYRGIRVIRIGKNHVPQFFLRPAAKKYHKDSEKYALANGHFPLSGDIAVCVRVYRPARRGDLDGFLKVLLDALQGIAYADDKQITELHAWRFDDKADPRVEIEVTTAASAAKESE